jgi:hypothetical protein
MIPTAEEFYKQITSCLINHKDIKTAMIEFAKLHVEAALKTADEKATVTPIDHEEISEDSWRPVWGVDSDSILNAYPLTNIK